MRRHAIGSRKLRWWQLRTEDFALLLYILIVPRVLVLGLYAVMAAFADSSGEPVYMSDFAGWNLGGYFGAMTLLSVLFIATCSVTALVERSYGRIKWLVVFPGMAALLFLAERTTVQTFDGFL